MADTQAPAAAQIDRMRGMAIAVYGLYLAALVSGITAVAGVVLAYAMRGDARGTIYESHFSNAIHTFWITLAGFAVLAAITIVMVAGGFGGVVTSLLANGHAANVDFNVAYLLLVPVLALGMLGLIIWFLYRAITGLVHTLDAKPY